MTSFFLLLFSLVGCGDDAAGGADGATDGGAADGASDAAHLGDAPRCDADDGCDDGVHCNGLETCASGRCAPGTPVDCDDGVECTADSCSEERRGCVHRAPDADGDGHAARACTGAGGELLGDDCDDLDPLRHLGSRELCDPDGRDEDCDLLTFGHRDEDGDGWADARCCNSDATGEAHCGDDCDDNRSIAHPGIPEACDGIDNDCDAIVDEGVERSFAPDSDGDGFGDPAGTPLSACVPPPAHVEDRTDCDDTRAHRHPGLAEVCDGVDNDCDETVDEGAPPEAFFRDADGDLHGLAAESMLACRAPAGYVASSDDCDDGSALRSPALPEICDDGVDNDCDFVIDESRSIRTWYRDLDGDMYGSAASGSTTACAPPVGYSAYGTDCDDAAASRHPAAAEACNGIDDNCNGRFEAMGEDDDDDGAPDASCGGTDCDDADPTVHPAAIEVCNGRDENCSTGGGPALEEDGDRDLHAPREASCIGGYPRDDCDDTCASCAPGGSEVCDGGDNDCDGTTDDGCPTSIRFGREADTAVIGTSVARHAALLCPDGMVLGGVSGWYDNVPGSSLTAVMGECRTPSLQETTTSTPYTYAIVLGDPGALTETAGRMGGSRPTRFDLICPAGYSVTGLRVGYQDLIGPIITSIQLVCSQTPVVVDATGAWSAATTGSHFVLATHTGPAAGTRERVDCASGDMARGLHARFTDASSPNRIRGLGLRCVQMLADVRP